MAPEQAAALDALKADLTAAGRTKDAAADARDAAEKALFVASENYQRAHYALQAAVQTWLAA
jgi:hypothetical protein